MTYLSPEMTYLSPEITYLSPLWPQISPSRPQIRHLRPQVLNQPHNRLLHFSLPSMRLIKRLSSEKLSQFFKLARILVF